MCYELLFFIPDSPLNVAHRSSSVQYLYVSEGSLWAEYLSSLTQAAQLVHHHSIICNIYKNTGTAVLSRIK
jgi:hypothetical protein